MKAEYSYLDTSVTAKEEVELQRVSDATVYRRASGDVTASSNL